MRGRSIPVAVKQHPLLLIQARNLITGLALPALLTDDEGDLVFYNEAAGALLGRRFEEAGHMPREEWAHEYGPFDDQQRPLAADHLPLAEALRRGRPAQGRFLVRLGERGLREVEVSALPLLETTGYEGSLVVFWPVEQGADATAN
jgi:PAS domain-containing protein